MKTTSRSVEHLWGWLKLSAQAEQTGFPTDIAVVDAAISPLGLGRIKYQGTYWFGRCESGSLPVGSQVRVLYRQGNTWTVQPLA